MRRKGLTCAAASSVSWSDLKPIWTFFGRWRKYLRNLKSGRRHMRKNGGRAGLCQGTSGAPNLPRPHPGRLRERWGPALSPQEDLHEVDPIPKPRLALPTRAPKPGGLEQISL